MTKYVIDTARPSFWEELDLADLQFVCDEETAEWEFDCNDIVFAHSHESYQFENPDLVLGEFDSNSEEVRGFCRALVSSVVKPWIVLYSGGDINQDWKYLAVSSGGALYGFPSERIQCYLETIHRQNCTGELKRMVEILLPQLESDRGGAAIYVDSSWLDEVKLAARLLVGAADSREEEFSGLEITKPSEPLLSAARKVIEAAARRENITPVANALCEVLGCSRPAQQ